MKMDVGEKELAVKFHVERLVDPTLLDALARDADADGHRMVSRLIEEWERNRFDGIGECAYVARAEVIVGVCGLNVDPFARNPTVGRVRRLYVSRSHRREGIATQLVQKIVSHALGNFRELHLRTNDPVASMFYEAMGFEKVDGIEECTHRLLI